MIPLLLITLFYLSPPPVFGESKTVDTMLNFLWNSSLETDRLQSYAWVQGTKSNPIITPNRYLVYEGNPLLAGQPIYKMDTWLNVVRAIGNYSHQIFPIDEFATGFKYTLVAIEFINIIRNHHVIRRTGLPAKISISFEWKF